MLKALIFVLRCVLMLMFIMGGFGCIMGAMEWYLLQTGQASPVDILYLDTLAGTVDDAIRQVVMDVLLMVAVVIGRIALAKLSRRITESGPKK